MKILFSPSESKHTGGTLPPIGKSSFLCPGLYDKRQTVLEKYERIMQEGTLEEKQKLSGLKKESDLALLSESLHTQSTLPAILRYSGVAYTHLAYSTLDEKAQSHIDQNTLIFSNLFGPIRASDPLPYYKLKQGETLDGFKSENHYREFFSDCIDSFLEEECILDLRAGFYEKFYTLHSPHITMKFIKGGKVVSHFAKAYRGNILREIALHQVQTEADLMQINFPGVKLLEIQERKLQKLILFEIL